MTRFAFTAYDENGRTVSGVLDARSRGEALEALAKLGRYPVEVKACDDSDGRARLLATGPARKLLPLGDQHVLARELASLAKARLPIDEALRIVSLQPGLSRAGRRTAATVLEKVLAGHSLGDALAACDRTVPDYFWRLIKAGEASGTVPNVLEELASTIEANARIRSQIASAMIYPAFLLAASLCTLLIIILVMLPTMMPLFQEAGAEMPTIIAVLSGVQTWITAYWPAAAAMLVLAVLGSVHSVRHEGVRTSLDKVVTRLPVVSGLVMRHNTARFARTLAMLLRNGVSPLEALRICRQVLDNRSYRASVEEAAASVNQGGSLIESLRASSLYPQLAMRLLSVGERSGQLVEMLGRVADLYEQDFNQRIQRLLAMVSPIATLAIGAVVGLLVVSVMSAVLSVNQLALQ